jgi:predicted membrane channel-forming protein YqfA (hemolysin III family)
VERLTSLGLYYSVYYTLIPIRLRETRHNADWTSAARIPECLMPGTFDYFGSSHQIFHVFVLVGAWSQYCALRGMVFSRNEAVGLK